MSAKSFNELRSQQPILSWARSDIEQKLFFSGGRFTTVSTPLGFLLAVLGSLAFYGLLLLLPDNVFSSKFIGQGLIPAAIVFFSMWSLAILALKVFKLRLQKRCLRMQVIPEDPEFVLSPLTVDRVNDRIRELVDDPRKFLLFHRITIALSNLRNIGRVSDVDEILRSQAESDEAASESSYVLLSGFLWAIPILGFIGTVLGLSVAIGEFGEVMSQASGGTGDLLPALENVTGGLGVAFDTTLQALVAALIIQILTTFLRKSEQEYLDACAEYCTENIVSRLKLLPYRSDDDA